MFHSKLKKSDKDFIIDNSFISSLDLVHGGRSIKH